MTGHGEIRARLVTEPVFTVPIAIGETTLAVRPLADVERDGPEIARILRRMRARQRVPASAAPIEPVGNPTR